MIKITWFDMLARFKHGGKLTRRRRREGTAYNNGNERNIMVATAEYKNRPQDDSTWKNEAPRLSMRVFMPEAHLDDDHGAGLVL